MNCVVDGRVGNPVPLVDKRDVEHAVDQPDLGAAGVPEPALDLFGGYKLVPLVGAHGEQPEGVLRSQDGSQVRSERHHKLISFHDTALVLFESHLVVRLMVVTNMDPPGMRRSEQALTKRPGFSTCSITSDATTASNLSSGPGA